MTGVFDDEELQPEQPRRYTEVTLSSMMLLAIFFGLVLICGLCFGLGYSLGRRGSEQASTAGQRLSRRTNNRADRHLAAQALGNRTNRRRA